MFALTGLAFWTYFQRAVSEGSQSLVLNAPLLTKTSCPRLLMPLSTVAAPLVDLVTAYVLVVVFTLAYGIAPTWRWLFFPMPIAVGIALAAGLGILLSAVNVRYRDVRNALPFLIQFLLFLSPFAYSLSDVQGTAKLVISINPLVGIVEGIRWSFSPRRPRRGRLSASPRWHRSGVGRRLQVLLSLRARFRGRRLTMTPLAIRTEGLGKRYRVPPNADRHRSTGDRGRRVRGWRTQARHGRQRLPPEDTFWALRDVTFDIAEGEVVGIVGANGAGKTTLLKLLSRSRSRRKGARKYEGVLARCSRLRPGSIPTFRPATTSISTARFSGCDGPRSMPRFDEIVEFAGVGEFLDMPVKRYSSGMYVRLAFSVAAHMEPEVLLVDEVLSVGDQAFQEKCLGRLSEVTNTGRTVLFVSHNLASLASLCTRGILIEGGEVVMDGDIDSVINTYLSRRRRASGGELAGLPRDGTGEVRFEKSPLLEKTGTPMCSPIVR